MASVCDDRNKRDVTNKTQLSPKRVGLAYQSLREISSKLLGRHEKGITILDLTGNRIEDFNFLLDLPQLDTLIVDRNTLSSHVTFPFCPKMSTLWINHNEIANLSYFIAMLEQSFPNLTCLSMMNNPAAPSFFNNGTFEQYTDYRHYVISRLQHLKLLDDEFVTEEDKKEAERIYPKHSL